MMKITLQQVEHVARLARLELTEQEKETLQAQLDSILSHIGKLNELDTSGVEPTSHVLPLANVFRDDEVRPPLAQGEALANAPDRHNDLFRVPKILE
jgi:aspartyl-tRNA(Asn)/glutamyl-tRNA(Gln) amidotransferase subunit C